MIGGRHKSNIELILVGIVAVSVIPIVVEFVRARRRGGPAPGDADVETAGPVEQDHR